MQRTRWPPYTMRKRCSEGDRQPPFGADGHAAGPPQVSAFHDQEAAVTDVKYFTCLHDILAGHVDAGLFEVFADVPLSFYNDSKHHLQKIVGLFGRLGDLLGKELQLVLQKTIEDFFIIISS